MIFRNNALNAIQRSITPKQLCQNCSEVTRLLCLGLAWHEKMSPRQIVREEKNENNLNNETWMIHHGNTLGIFLSYTAAGSFNNELGKGDFWTNGTPHRHHHHFFYAKSIWKTLQKKAGIILLMSLNCSLFLHVHIFFIPTREAIIAYMYGGGI